MILKVIWAFIIRLLKLISVIPLSILYILKWIGVIIFTPIIFLVVAIIEVQKLRRGKDVNISDFRPPFGDE